MSPSERISPSAISREKDCRFRAARARAGEPETDSSDQDGSEVGLVTHAAVASIARGSVGGGVFDPLLADEAVRRRGVPPAVLEDAVPLVAAAIRTIRDRGVSVLAVEQELEIDVGGGAIVNGWADLVCSREDEEAGTVAELWDWKTTERPPPTSEDLLNDPQIAAYLCWLRGAYPNAAGWLARWVYLRHGPRIVTVRWQAGLEAWLVTEARRAVRARRLEPERSPATPGEHCCWCPYRSKCAPLTSWLNSPLPSPGDEASIDVLARAYDDVRARAKVTDQQKSDLADRLHVLLGDRTRVEGNGVRVTRVTQTRETWNDNVVYELRDMTGEDAGEIWRRVGKVNGKKVDAEVDALPAEKRVALEDYRETKSSEYVLVTVK